MNKKTLWCEKTSLWMQNLMLKEKTLTVRLQDYLTSPSTPTFLMSHLHRKYYKYKSHKYWLGYRVSTFPVVLGNNVGYARLTLTKIRLHFQLNIHKLNRYIYSVFFENVSIYLWYFLINFLTSPWRIIWYPTPPYLF